MMPPSAFLPQLSLHQRSLPHPTLLLFPHPNNRRMEVGVLKQLCLKCKVIWMAFPFQICIQTPIVGKPVTEYYYSWKALARPGEQISLENTVGQSDQCLMVALTGDSWVQFV
ncbi:hypothetical protein V6N11_017330 [Hibiscus sabdariffa]|uniref:Uncharacterized protein n=1 Tax=Hibiscus sabdariffa TaxID=183260 RepID=A0ABR2TXP2_9ROSI